MSYYRGNTHFSAVIHHRFFYLFVKFLYCIIRARSAHAN